MSSIEHVHATAGLGRRTGEVTTGRADDVGPEPRRSRATSAEFVAGEAFAYSVLDGDDVIGCVYIDPDRSGAADTMVRSWVRASRAERDLDLAVEIDESLREHGPCAHGDGLDARRSAIAGTPGCADAPNGATMTTSIGIDVAEARKGLDLVAMDARRAPHSASPRDSRGGRGGRSRHPARCRLFDAPPTWASNGRGPRSRATAPNPWHHRVRNTDRSWRAPVLSMDASRLLHLRRHLGYLSALSNGFGPRDCLGDVSRGVR